MSRAKDWGWRVNYTRPPYILLPSLTQEETQETAYTHATVKTKLKILPNIWGGLYNNFYAIEWQNSFSDIKISAKPEKLGLDSKSTNSL